jgi:hypothetical protein
LEVRKMSTYEQERFAGQVRNGPLIARDKRLQPFPPCP